VIARQDRPGDQRLVAYLVAAGAERPAAGELRAWAGGQLPHYMVPAAFAWLDALPLTPNGKLDRNALPPPGDVEQLLASTPPVEPRTVTEQQIAAIWQTALGVTAGVQHDFFEVGGNSLLAAQVVLSIRREFAVDMPLETIFDYPTISALAEIVEEAVRADVARLSEAELMAYAATTGGNAE
jgi:nonribosomal peptide synthetase DhbF